MSDYLWDKTGEADEETRRLEELLGGLKFQPRPLELPAAPARNVNTARTTPRSLLSWPRLAVAASLTAALLLGAWLMSAERRTTESDARQLAGTTGAGNGEQAKYQPTMPMKNDAQAAKGGGGDKQSPSSDGPGQLPRASDAAVPVRPRRARLARVESKPRANRGEVAKLKTPGATPERRELIAREFTREEIAAAEKVMYALRLTSEKLSYARRQVQDAGRRETNR